MPGAGGNPRRREHHGGGVGHDGGRSRGGVLDVDRSAHGHSGEIRGGPAGPAVPGRGSKRTARRSHVRHAGRPRGNARRTKAVRAVRPALRRKRPGDGQSRPVQRGGQSSALRKPDAVGASAVCSGGAVRLLRDPPDRVGRRPDHASAHRSVHRRVPYVHPSAVEADPRDPFGDRRGRLPRPGGGRRTSGLFRPGGGAVRRHAGDLLQRSGMRDLSHGPRGGGYGLPRASGPARRLRGDLRHADPLHPLRPGPYDRGFRMRRIPVERKRGFGSGGHGGVPPAVRSPGGGLRAGSHGPLRLRQRHRPDLLRTGGGPLSDGIKKGPGMLPCPVGGHAHRRRGGIPGNHVAGGGSASGIHDRPQLFGSSPFTRKAASVRSCALPVPISRSRRSTDTAPRM